MCLLIVVSILPSFHCTAKGIDVCLLTSAQEGNDILAFSLREFFGSIQWLTHFGDSSAGTFLSPHHSRSMPL